MVEAMGSDPASGLSGAEAASRLSRYGRERDHGRRAALDVGGGAAAAARAHEHHARRRHGREPAHRRAVHRGHRGAADPAQPGARDAAGAEGAGEHRRAVEPAGATGEGLRDGAVALVAATEIVPGDIVQLEAGDIVPADGRIVRSATLETQEAALTGESAPVAKDAAALDGAEVAVGDRVQHAVPEHGGDPWHGDGDGRHRDRHGDADGSDRDDADLGHPHALAAAARARLPDEGARHHRVGRGRVHRDRRAGARRGRSATWCCSARRWPSRRSRPACRRSCRASSPSARSSWPTPRRWSRTSPTSRRWARRARSTPTRPAPSR